MFFRLRSLLPRWLMILSMSIAVWLWGGQAHAGYWEDVTNGWEQLSRLPGEVQQLQDSYQETKAQLEEAQQSLESYQELNAKLSTQNQQLAATVSELTQLQQQREAASHRNRILLWTAVGLFAGYFLFIRVLRLIMKLRSGQRY